jgi:NAD-dependent dihydropyrimidine dehydrogenase PreA subunit
MAYVIGSACVGVKDASCTEVCPVSCIHPTPDEPGFQDVDQLFIDPGACIDCDACVLECPVEAISAEENVSADERGAIAKNAGYYEE